MAKTMKGVIIGAVGSPYKVVDDLDVPEPGEGQVLVKSIATSINPVETYMSSTGLLIKSFPIVLGCDSSGLIAQTAPNTALKLGQRICGCTRLGFPGYSTFQQYFLLDERFGIVPPSSLGYNEAFTHIPFSAADWEGKPNHSLHRTKLAYIGRSAEECSQPDLDSSFVSYANFITRLLAEGRLKPNEADVGTGSFEAVAGAVETQLKSAGGKKVVVELNSVDLYYAWQSRCLLR
ncbi:MAG: hypothetical protein Q9173_004624 [Seirophora scorigena]